MLDALLDAVLDSLKILPFLFITYLVMEYLESHTEDRVRNLVKRAGWMGPFWGSLLGAVPQCGFSAAASNLYAGRAISLGTLIAIFLSTSDEMVPIMISEAVPLSRMIKLLLAKLIIGIICGFVIDGFCHIRNSRRTGQPEDGEDFLIERLCEKEHCHCENGSIVGSALKHTLHIILFVFAITVLLNLAFLFLGEDRLTAVISSRPITGMFLSALIGLIPNCAASVAITSMYLDGAMSAGAMMSGLMVGAGVGILVLARSNRSRRESAKMIGILYAAGVIGGLLTSMLRIF